MELKLFLQLLFTYFFLFAILMLAFYKILIIDRVLRAFAIVTFFSLIYYIWFVEV